MTRKSRPNTKTKRQKSAPAAAVRENFWRLEEAKAKFSELVRRVKTEGPQHVTLHGVEAVVVVSAEDFQRFAGRLTGEALISVMQASPEQDVELGFSGVRSQVRDVSL
jgi:prevent-host-death family protein